MFMRLLDSLLPAVVLAAMVLAMASAFGALSPSEPPPATRVVTLQRVVVTRDALPATVASVQTAPAATSLR